MKKVLTIIISLMLLCSMVGICAAATGESTQHYTAVNYTLESEYTINIPTTIDVGTRQNITVMNQLLNTSEYLCFKTNNGSHYSFPANSYRHMFLVGGESDKEKDYINYNITADVADLNVFTSPSPTGGANQEIVIDKWYVLASAKDTTLLGGNKKDILILANIINGQTPRYAGKYTDTVTITCDIMTENEITNANGNLA